MKLFNKIAVLSIGAVLAIGGAVIARNEVKSASAASNKELTFDLSSNPGGWPTTNSTTLTDYTYTLEGEDYTFALANTKCNSGYLMITKPGYLGLPAIDGYKLSKVVASNSGGCSTTVKVGIGSAASTGSYLEGGEAVTWSTTSSSYTYELSETQDNTVYYIVVTDKNAQITSLSLTYMPSSSDDSISSLAITPTNKNYVAGTVIESTDFDAVITKNGSTGSMEDVTAQIGTKSGDTFTPRSAVTFGTTLALKEDNCIRFKAIYPILPNSDEYLTADVNLTVSYAPIESFVVDETLSVDIASSKKINVSIGSQYAEQGATFESDDEDVATVDANGNVTGVSAGTCTITVTSNGVDSTAAHLTREVAVTVNASAFYTATLGVVGFTDIAAAANITSVEETISVEGEWLTFSGVGSSAVRIVGPSKDNTKGQQFGTTSNAFTAFSFTTSNFGAKKINKVVVKGVGAAATSAGNVDVKVGGATFGTQASLSGSTEYELVFTGSAFGSVEVDFSSIVKGIFVKSISVYGSDDNSIEAIANEFARSVELEDSCSGSHAGLVVEYEALGIETVAIANAIVIHDWNGAGSEKGSRSLALTVEAKMEAIYTSLSSGSVLAKTTNDSVILISVIVALSVSAVGVYFLLRKKKLAE